jgi:hypothetical protein
MTPTKLFRPFLAPHGIGKPAAPHDDAALLLGPARHSVAVARFAKPWEKISKNDQTIFSDKTKVLAAAGQLDNWPPLMYSNVIDIVQA